jgi:ATP-dependent DNA helicase DinG
MLYLPAQLPEPNQGDYTLALMRRVWPLIIANGGRAFLLFTSYKAMQLAADTLRPHLPFPLLMQGEQDAHQLIATFRSKGNAVLLATASFWEGVDVSGSALSLVVIDKIPFSPPDDPVAQAREALLVEKGLSAFVCEQLPDATMALIQGAGRLIRSETDRGVLVIGDPRITQKHYGKQILAALPPMKQTRSNAEAVAFIHSMGVS